MILRSGKLTVLPLSPSKPRTETIVIESSETSTMSSSSNQNPSNPIQNSSNSTQNPRSPFSEKFSRLQHQSIVLPIGITLKPDVLKSLPYFRGTTDEDAERHIQRFLSICQEHGLQSDSELMLYFKHTLKESADQWYWRLDFNSLKTFNDFAEKFLRDYSKIGNNFPFYQALQEIYQEPNESVIHYAWRVKEFFRNCVDSGILATNLPLDMFKNGLKPEIQLSLYHRMPVDLEDAIEKAIDVERAHEPAYQPYHRQGRQNQFNSLFRWQIHPIIFRDKILWL